MPDYLAIGTRVRLTHSVDRFPHFIAPQGAQGTLVISEPAVVAVRLDEHLDGAEEWDNEVCWYPSNGDFPADDMEAIA